MKRIRPWIPNPPRMWSVALFVALAGICAALGFSYFAELNRSRSMIKNSLNYWAPEFADIFSHQDWLRLSKLGRTFATPPVHSLIFKNGDRAVFSFPLESDDSPCRLTERHRIENYGILVGELQICYQPGVVLLQAATSPLFLATSLPLIFLMGFVALFPVISVRRGLTLLVDHLREWSNKADATKGATPTAELAPGGRSLEGKIQSLVHDLVQRRLESERKAMRNEITHDVAHNIRSPVTTLTIRVETSNDVSPQMRTTLLEGLREIQNILDKLRDPGVTRNTPKPIEEAPSEVKVEMLSSILDSIVTDKRLEKSNQPEVELQYQLSPQSYGAFASVSAGDFRIVVSNLLNNAYEATQGPSKVEVILQAMDTVVKVAISDHGCGMPPAEIESLLNEQPDPNRPRGRGRGVPHAKRIIESWKGTISITSQVGRGTTVVIELPKAPAPNWFLSSLDISEVDQIVVLDDDPSISGIWRTLIPSREIVSFTDPGTFGTWIASNRTLFDSVGHRPLFLVDLRLGDGLPSGLDLIESEGIAESAVLVTSEAVQQGVQRRCSFVGARLLWKREIHLVSIEGATRRMA